MLLNILLFNKPNTYSKTLKEDIINLGSPTMTNPQWVEYTVHKVSKAHVARPDLVSQAIYGTDMYGDLICKINNIPNPFELNEGDILVVPKINHIPEFLITDDFDEQDYTIDGQVKPAPKRSKEKRKANEAVVGDTRFKVDRDNRVIIY